MSRDELDHGPIIELPHGRLYCPHAEHDGRLHDPDRPPVSPFPTLAAIEAAQARRTNHA